MLLTVVVIQGLLPCFRGLNFSWKNQKIEYVLPPCVCTERKHDIKTYEVHAWTKPHTLIKTLTINVTYTWYMYVITIIRNQHSIYTRILAAFPTDCLLASSSLASKTGSTLSWKYFQARNTCKLIKGHLPHLQRLQARIVLQLVRTIRQWSNDTIL